MATLSTGGAGTAGSWEKGPVVAAPNTVFTAVACEAAVDVDAGGAGAARGMETEKGPSRPLPVRLKGPWPHSMGQAQARTLVEPVRHKAE